AEDGRSGWIDSRASRPPARDPQRGPGDPLADEGALSPRRRDRPVARLLAGDGGGDPRPGRALGWPRPATRPARDRDTAGGQDPLPGADGGGLSRRARGP